MRNSAPTLAKGRGMERSSKPQTAALKTQKVAKAPVARAVKPAPKPTGKTSAKPAPKAASSKKAAPAKPIAKKAAPAKPAPKPAAPRPAAPKPAAPKPAVKNVASAKPTAKSAKPAPKPVAAKPVAAKPAAKKSFPAKSSTAKPAPKPVAKKAAPAKPAPKKTVAAKPATTALRETSKASRPVAKPAPKAVAAKPASKPVAKAPAKSLAKPLAKPVAKPLPKPAPVPVPKAPRLADAIKAFEAAVKLFQRGNFSTARDAFEKLRDRYPNQTEILARVQMYVNICVVRLQTPARPPQTPDQLYDQGVVELNRANFGAAVELFKRALKSQPSQPHVLYSLAAAQVRAGDADEGLRTLELAVEAKELNRSHARNDPDFAALRGDLRFQELVGLLGL